jgi:hypothetical protein
MKYTAPELHFIILPFLSSLRKSTFLQKLYNLPTIAMYGKYDVCINMFYVFKENDIHMYLADFLYNHYYNQLTTLLSNNNISIVNLTDTFSIQTKLEYREYILKLFHTIQFSFNEYLAEYLFILEIFNMCIVSYCKNDKTIIDIFLKLNIIEFTLLPVNVQLEINKLIHIFRNDTNLDMYYDLNISVLNETLSFYDSDIHVDSSFFIDFIKLHSFYLPGLVEFIE